jgi:hypothetical protein
MGHRNELPQSGWNLPPGVSESDPYFTDESVSICPGYGESECGNEKDYDADLCDECKDSADLDARNDENDLDLLYPHLMD